MKAKKSRSGHIVPFTLCLLLATSLLTAASAHSSSMKFWNWDWNDFGKQVAGTYYIQEGNGAISLWTFSSNGTMTGASSAQAALDFGPQHGTWKRTGPRQIAVVLLDFSYGKNGSLKNVARVDSTVRFNRNFSRIEGELTVRFFDPETEDPLNLSTYTGPGPETDTLSGERLTVSGD